MPIVIVTAGIAALAAVAGGLVAHWRRPTTLAMSLIFGFTAGVMTATVAFEMLPRALELGPLTVVAAGFGAGFCLVYGLDLLLH